MVRCAGVIRTGCERWVGELTTRRRFIIFSIATSPASHSAGVCFSRAATESSSFSCPLFFHFGRMGLFLFLFCSTLLAF